MHLVPAKRQPTVAPHEAEEDREVFAPNVRVIIDGEIEPVAIKPFANEYGRVRTDKVVQPKGMPPAEWAVL